MSYMIEETKKLIVKTNDHLLINLDIYGALIKQQLKLTNDFVTNFDPRTAGTTFYSNIIASTGYENPEIMGYMGLTDDNYDLEKIFTEELTQYSYRAIFVSLYNLFEASLFEVSLGVKSEHSQNANCKDSDLKKYHDEIKLKISPPLDFADIDRVFKEIDQKIRHVRNKCVHEMGTFNLDKPKNKKLFKIIKSFNEKRELIKTLRHCCEKCSEEKLERVGDCPNCRYDIVILDGFIEHTLQLMTCYAKMLNAHLNNKINVRDNN